MDASSSDSELVQSAAVSILEILGLGIAFVDRDGSVQYLNSEARRIFAKQDGLMLDKSRILCGDPAASRKISECIEGAFRDSSSERREHCEPIRVEKKSGAPSFAMFVNPDPRLRDLRRSQKNARPLATIIITDPERGLGLSTQSLSSLYKISRTEAAVLNGLLAGSTVEQLAGALGVTSGTVRSHLKRIFKATRTQRQGELIRRVMLDLAWAKENAVQDGR